MEKPGIYLIVDMPTLGDRDFLEVVSRSLDAGVDIIQLRDKVSSDRDFFEAAKKIKSLLRDRDALFIINDRVDTALTLDSDGVHLGQEDLSAEAARVILGRDKVIGLSTHSIEEVREASKKDIDYIGVGPIFDTKTKPGRSPIGTEFIKTAKRETGLPFVAIGGINELNIKDVFTAGANKAALASAVLCEKDIFKAVRDLTSRI